MSLPQRFHLNWSQFIIITIMVRGCDVEPIARLLSVDDNDNNNKDWWKLLSKRFGMLLLIQDEFLSSLKGKK